MYTKEKENLSFFFLFFMFFLLLFTSCSAGRQELADNQKLYSPLNISIPEDLSVPLIVRKYYDETGAKDCSFIPDIFFSRASPDFNPGFYNGNLWLDIYFPDTVPKLGSNYMLDIGEEPCDFVELFIEKDGVWKFRGRTGRSILINQMSYPSWRLCIPVSAEDFDSSKVHHLRIRMMSSLSNRINLKLLPIRNYQFKITNQTMLYSLTSGFFIVAIIFLLCYGLIFKDKIYIMLSIAASLLMLARTQYKGIGPVYYWNFLAPLSMSNRLLFTIMLLSISFLIMNFIFIFKEQHGSIKCKPLLVCIFIILLISLIMSLTVPSSRIAYSVFAYGFITVIIVTSCFIIANKIDFKKDLHVFFMSWFLCIAVLVIKQLFHLVAIHFDVTTYTIFECNFNYSFDLIFLFALLPAIYISARRLKKRFSLLKSHMDFITKKTTELRYKQKVTFTVMHELLNEQNVLQNALRLPAKSDKVDEQETHALLIKTSARSLDLLNTLCILSENKTPEEKTFLLLPFFHSCVNTVQSFAKNRGNTIAVTAAVASDRIIIANPNIIEFIFADFFSTVIKYSPRNTRVTINIEDTDGLITCSMHNSSKHVGTKNALSLYDIDYSELDNDTEGSSLGLGFHLIKMAAEFYGGTVSHESQDDGTLFTVTIRCAQLYAVENKEPIVLNCARNEIMEETNLKSKKQIMISDKLLSPEGKMPTILLVEDSFENRDLITSQLDTHSTVLNSVNGLEAWNFLNSYETRSALPDLIIAEYDLPLLGGGELFRKCRQEPLLQDIPFIFIAPLGEVAKKNEIIERGAADCLIKPFSSEELFARIYSVLMIKNMAHHEMLSKISTMVQVKQPSDNDAADVYNEQPVVKRQNGHTVSLTATQQVLFSAASLSSREQQIALLISEGKSDKQIAEELFISPATVSTHNKKLFKKLGVHSRVELMNKVR